MKISHPRYLSYGNVDSLKVGYPACLEKKINFGRADPVVCADDVLQSVYLFPAVGVVMVLYASFSNYFLVSCLSCYDIQDTTVSGDTPFSWPLWFHASEPGTLSLYIVLCYEIEDTESFMKYRTLRMCYNLEVLSSE